MSAGEPSQAFLKDRPEAPPTFLLLLAFDDFCGAFLALTIFIQPGGATATRYKVANTVSGRKGDSVREHGQGQLQNELRHGMCLSLKPLLTGVPRPQSSNE